jgi:NADH-quinone oxidoreductase subunit G
MKVNQYWMCDYGRLNTFKFVNDAESRVSSPMMRPLEAGILNDGETELQKCEWDDALARVISELKNYSGDEIAFIASPYSTLEDNYALKRFANEVIGTENIVYIPDIIENAQDDILIRADRTPNATGLKYLGIKAVDNSFLDKIKNKLIKLVYIINDSVARLPEAEQLSKHIEVGIIQISNFNEMSRKATIILPAATYAEINGTFVNFEGMVQRIRPAVATLEMERIPGEFTVSRLDKFGAQNDRWTKGTKFNARPVWKVFAQLAKAMGHNFGYANTEEVLIDIASKVPELSGLDYEVIGTKGVLAGQTESVG